MTAKLQAYPKGTLGILIRRTSEQCGSQSYEIVNSYHPLSNNITALTKTSTITIAYDKFVCYSWFSIIWSTEFAEIIQPFFDTQALDALKTTVVLIELSNRDVGEWFFVTDKITLDP